MAIFFTDVEANLKKKMELTALAVVERLSDVVAKRNAMQYFVMSFQPIQAAIFLSIGMPLFFSRYLLSLFTVLSFVIQGFI